MGRNFGDGDWAPYVPVAQRQRQARQEAAGLKKAGHVCQPVRIEGRRIANSFWGQAWCDNLASYSDYANRLPRGRTYVRNGSVIDLRIDTGRVRALVSGSQVYTVEIGVQPLPAAQWNTMVRECSGQVASLVELLQGRLSAAVMATVTRRGAGLFPQPRQISLSCSCPDSATMCKHVAAVLYGVGWRLDSEPELLFRLRHVDPQDLTQPVGGLSALVPAEARGGLQGSDLSALFGIDLEDEGSMASAPGRSVPQVAAPPTRKAAPPVEAAALQRGRNSRPAERPAARSKTITASELISRGVARHMIQAWVVSGVLLRTEQRGVYRTTPQTESRIRDYAVRHLPVLPK